LSGGLLVIGAHPDDEVLLAGGTLAACAADGTPTGVLCLTRGEQGPIADPALATRNTLADVRLAELRASCAELGVPFVRCWRRADGSLRQSNRSAVVRQIGALLDAFRPEAVITFGEDGLYYHPDHVAVHELTVRAVRRLNVPPALYRSVWPKTLMRELGQELRRTSPSSYLWQLEPEEFGTEDVTGSFAVDVRQYVDRKLAALMAHRTQVPNNHAFVTLARQLLDRFLGTEWFAPINGQGPGWLSQVAGVG
jgi:N-acetyl-1-D-myo-inositol-2-amino-2-deoxy-alpha-D-glucopyranoside deacetylase